MFMGVLPTYLAVYRVCVCACVCAEARRDDWIPWTGIWN